MQAIWQSNLGRLLIGSCGAQVGMILTCGGLGILALFCFICATTNGVSLDVAQEGANLLFPTATLEPAPSPPSAIDSIIGEVRLLHREIEGLRTNIPVVDLLPTATPTPTPRPFITAQKGGVNLRSGPGTDYKKVGVVSRGESLEIVGRNSDSTWWLVTTREGLFAWISADFVASNNLHNNIPEVTIPSLLVWGTPTPVSAIASPAAGDTGAPVAISSPFAFPTTPTPGPNVSRTFVEDMSAYRRLRGHLLVPPVSASISPDGSQIAITERIKLYTVTTDGALTTVWIEDDANQGPIGGVAWSPDGEYVAFLMGYKNQYCNPCRGVFLLRPADGLITPLEHPGDLDLDAPRWTIDGRLLVNAHPGEPADGVAYIYDKSGKGQVATGAYVLSSSNEGQKWYPWQPGKTWLVGSTERADAYNSN
jgi:hypothetical protein